MIYELRTYWAPPGKQDQMHARFRNLTVGLFARHGLNVIGFWVPEPATAESGDLVYILAFSGSGRARSWLERVSRGPRVAGRQSRQRG